MVILLLSPGPFSLHTMHDAAPSCPMELLLLTFLMGSVLLSFLSVYSFQRGPGSLFFFFASR